MNVLAIQSSGNETSLCVILGDDVLEYSISHQRKDRPNWQEMLSQIGLDSFFFIDDIDIFAYANDEGSYTATRSVASFLKGISSAKTFLILITFLTYYSLYQFFLFKNI